MASEGDDNDKMSTSEAGDEKERSASAAANEHGEVSQKDAELETAAMNGDDGESRPAAIHAEDVESAGEARDVAEEEVAVAPSTEQTAEDTLDDAAGDEVEQGMTSSTAALEISDGNGTTHVDDVSEHLPDLDIDDDDDDEPALQHVFAPHKRTDSVPPQRYDIAALSQTYRAGPPGSPSRFADEQYRAHSGTLRAQGLGLGGADMERDDSMSSETEEAGLDFVDVSLGAAVQSPYGAGAQMGASRSALEIRNDSIASSDSSVARNRLSRESTRRRDSTSSASYDRPVDGEASGDLGETPKPRQSRRMHIGFSGISAHEARTRTVSSSSTGAMTPRSAEGRYRGRLSEPNSGAASPVLQSPGLPDSTSGRSAFTREPPSPSVQMIVVGEDGEIRPVPTSNIAIESPERERPRETSNGSASGSQEEEALEDTARQAKERNASDVPIEGELSNGTRELQEDTSKGTPSVEEEQAKEISSPVLQDAADGDKDKSKDKERRKSAGVPSALEQHMSRTRMVNLPPKPKQEDVRHLNDFENLMKQSREMERKRQQEEANKRLQRDQELQENMKIWESDILPSWTRARREGKLRKLWWKGIPPNLRGRLWAMTCGNNQMLPRNLFAKAIEEVREGRRSGTFPQSAVDAILQDIEGTLPTLRLFQKDIGALHDDLFDLLCAFTEYRLDQLRARAATTSNGHSLSEQEDSIYVPGTASLAAMLMINLAPSEALIALINLIAEKPWLSALYTVQGAKEEKGIANGKGRRTQQQQHPAIGFERVFDTLLADQWPKIYANMQARGIRPSSYGSQWMRTLFVPYLPLETVARLWDCILLDEGDALLYRIGIAIFSLLSARLYVPDKAELISILRGNNRASIGVWNRFRTDRDVVTSPAREKREPVFDDEGGANDSETGKASQDGAGPRSPPTSPGAAPQTPVAIGRRSSSQADSSRDSVLRRFSNSGVEAPEEMVPRDDIYGGQYSITETMLFRTLEEQDTWWKNSTLERLLDRELVS